MNRSTRIVSTVAILVGVCGWLLLTKRGQHVVERMKAERDRLIEKMRHAQAIGEKAKAAFSDGRQLVSDLKALRESA
jgi:hypothetical protein